MARHWVHGCRIPVTVMVPVTLTITITVAIPMAFTLVAASVIGAFSVIVMVVIAIVAHDDDRRRVPGRPVLLRIPPVVTRRRRRILAVPVEVVVTVRVLVAGWDCDAARDGERADDQAEPSRRDTSTNEAHGQSSAS